MYFPESGVVSILTLMGDGAEIEVGTVGSKGMTGLTAFLGGHEMPTECVVQIPGTAQRMCVQALRDATRDASPLREILLCYAQYFFHHTARSVACSSVHTVEQRCARWLLTTRGRVGDDLFEMTPSHLAALLGVRRAGVSTVADSLRRKGAIGYVRGRVRIRDAAMLESVACECYRHIREEFERLLGKAASMSSLARCGWRALPPEKAIVAVKTAARDAGLGRGDDAATQLTLERIVRWSIREYYRSD